MLLFGGHRREDDAGGRQTHVLSVLLDVGLANSGETEKPQHTVRDTLQDLQRGGSFEQDPKLGMLKALFYCTSEVKKSIVFILKSVKLTLAHI